MAREFSMIVMGAAYPNADGSNRQFEILTCVPGEPVTLRPEPRNPVDASAVAVLNARGGQIGYLPADRCGWIAGKLAGGADIRAVFQGMAAAGPVIRVNMIGQTPTLPAAAARTPPPPEPRADDDFFPDPVWPD